MIKNLESAQKALNMVFESIHVLENSIVEIGGHVPDEELGKYKIQVGHIMSEVFDRIIKPVLTEHPELIPESYKDWFKP